MSMFGARRTHKDEIDEIHDMNDQRPRVVELPRASSLPAALDQAEGDVDRVRAEMTPYVPVKHQKAKRTDLEEIAGWVELLTYTDMKKFAVEVLGDAKPTTPGELADLFEAWAAKLLGPKPGESAQ